LNDLRSLLPALTAAIATVLGGTPASAQFGPGGGLGPSIGNAPRPSPTQGQPSGQPPPGTPETLCCQRRVVVVVLNLVLTRGGRIEGARRERLDLVVGLERLRVELILRLERFRVEVRRPGHRGVGL
jgi:hypothetical protein